MGKRCEVINNGQPCPYLAQDGTCLLVKDELKEKCLARETRFHEEKDKWMLEEISSEDVGSVEDVLGDRNG